MIVSVLRRVAAQGLVVTEAKSIAAGWHPPDMFNLGAPRSLDEIVASVGADTPPRRLPYPIRGRHPLNARYNPVTGMYYLSSDSPPNI